MLNASESLLLAHFSDLHYSTGNLAEADRCFGFAVEHAIAAGSQVAVVSGDSTDHRLDAHTPALRVLAERIRQLSEHMAIVMLQGTFSHEPPGTLDLFRLVGSRHPVYIADRIHQVALRDGEFTASDGALFTPIEIEGCLPTVPRRWSSPVCPRSTRPCSLPRSAQRMLQPQSATIWPPTCTPLAP
jgi:exonuclease SbcD